MDQIKNNVAKNISANRRRLGLTQLQLAERLNYSDKAVSKWERGEAVPDIYIMHELAVMFGMTVDELIGAEPLPPKKEEKPHLSLTSLARNKVVITLLSVGLCWLVATVLFVVLQWAHVKWDNWLTFIYALPASCIVGLVFNMMWGRRIGSTLIISALIWTIALSVLLTFDIQRIWLIFIVGIPLQILTVIWYFLKRK